MLHDFLIFNFFFWIVHATLHCINLTDKYCLILTNIIWKATFQNCFPTFTMINRHQPDGEFLGISSIKASHPRDIDLVNSWDHRYWRHCMRTCTCETERWAKNKICVTWSVTNVWHMSKFRTTQDYSSTRQDSL